MDFTIDFITNKCYNYIEQIISNIKEVKTVRDYESMAAALYDGGWRAEDREQLKAEYDLTDEDLERIIDLLATYEA